MSLKTTKSEKIDSQNSAVVLMSAGLDSTYNLYAALDREIDVKLALTFDYGQRAAVREIEQSRRICAAVGVKHQVVELPWFAGFTQSSLVNRKVAIPVASEVDISNLKTSEQTAVKVWVPNRNGIFLNIAAGFAEGLGANQVIPGFNLEEAQTFPDNSQGFMSALDGAFQYSTSNHVKVRCFSAQLDKSQIVGRALQLRVPLKDLWPCYFAGASWCGECESCLRFARALEANGVKSLWSQNG